MSPRYADSSMGRGICAKEQKLTGDCARLATRIRKLERRMDELESGDEAASKPASKARVLR